MEDILKEESEESSKKGEVNYSKIRQDTLRSAGNKCKIKIEPDYHVSYFDHDDMGIKIVDDNEELMVTLFYWTKARNTLHFKSSELPKLEAELKVRSDKFIGFIDGKPYRVACLDGWCPWDFAMIRFKLDRRCNLVNAFTKIVRLISLIAENLLEVKQIRQEQESWWKK